jgi:hypothetical protein
MTASLETAITAYARAKGYIVAAGFQEEVEWQRSRHFRDFCESDLLCEAAWVILCSGFRELTVRKVFGYISLCFCDWESAQCILEHATACRSTALACFNNAQKIDAIVHVAREIQAVGFEALRKRILDDPLNELQRFPYIGPVTSIHLAKNLGWQLSKPDRHMVRLALKLGFPHPQHLCQTLAEVTGDSVNVVDIVLWRYAVETNPRLIPRAD